MNERMPESKKIRENVRLGPYTSMGVGGPARFFTEPASAEDVMAARQWADERELSFYVLGSGTNCIISDKGYDGLIIRLGEKFSGIKWEGHRAIVRAGTVFEELINQSVEKGLGGFEKLAGIPGSAGGAVYMNAGAFEQSTADCAVLVKSIRNGAVIERKKEDLAFEYRKSVYTNSNEIIIEVEFEFSESDPAVLSSVKEEIIQRRHAKQPWDQKCAGSIFRRPPGNYAGTLIEKLGLKGFRVGGAAVSTKHAGFIVNTGGATAEDIHQLIRHIVKTVEAEYGIRLEREVIFLGDFHA